MCGRFSFAPLVKIIEDRFDVRVNTLKYKPSYNCAPSQNLAVISSDNMDEINFYRWGLIPFWAKDISIGNKLINAKAETIDEKPSFRNSFKQKRCLVLSDGFYEWKKISSKEKQPFFISLPEKALFAMAGIWDTWKDAEGKPINSFSIITTSPNNLMQGIHQRMPVILKRNDEKSWLEESSPSKLKTLLKPFDEELIAIPVSKEVNSPINNSAKLIEAVSINKENTLF